MSEYSTAAAKLCWDNSIASAWLEVSEFHNKLPSDPGHCPECKVFWVPGQTCILRTATNRNKNKKQRAKAQKKRQKYLEHAQTLKQFTPNKPSLKLERKCQCSFVQYTTVKMPKVVGTVAAKPSISKSQSAKERAKQRKINRLDKAQPQPQQPLAGLMKPSLSLNDFLL